MADSDTNPKTGGKQTAASVANGEAVPDASIFVHHAEAIWEQRETYGPPGFAGLLSSPYAAACAAFAALGGKIEDEASSEMLWLTYNRLGLRV